MAWKTLDDVDLAGKVVLVRVDINVPLEAGRVTDATRIEKIVPTIKDILAKGGKPVLLAHFGRPKGQVVPEMSLAQLVPALEAALGSHVTFASNCIGGPAKTAVAAMGPGEVVLLENTRFHPGEEKNDAELSASMAALGEVYVNDAFSAAHRAHSSTEGIAHILPAVAGRLMAAELKALEAALGKPERPVVAVVGGAKVSTKLELLGNLVSKVEHLVIGGGMANTFLVAQGTDVGKSTGRARHGRYRTRRFWPRRQTRAAPFTCRSIVVVAREFKAGAETETLPVDACPADAMILDAGPETVAAVNKVFERSKTLIWNGPLGAFEIAPFDAATTAAATHAAELTREGKLISVAGGGDTVAALNKAGAAADFTYISTAGGAFLEWMEGKELPGVAALMT